MSKLICWIKAIRPQTLFVSMSSVILATATAIHVTDIEWLPACLCLVFAMLAQITSNLANDYADFVNGSDKNRIGPPRMASSGLIAPRKMYNATVLCAILSFFTGLPLIWWGGWWLLIPGIIIIIAAIAYSSGPFPFSYHSLGDIAVIVFYGIIPVSFTFYILTETFNYRILLEGLLLGLIINELLIVNNYRDMEQDAMNNKKTTVLLFGRKPAKFIFVMIPYIVTLLTFWLLSDRVEIKNSIVGFIPFVIYVTFVNLRFVKAEKEELNKLLGMASLESIVYTFSTILALSL